MITTWLAIKPRAEPLTRRPGKSLGAWNSPSSPSIWWQTGSCCHRLPGRHHIARSFLPLPFALAFTSFSQFPLKLPQSPGAGGSLSLSLTGVCLGSIPKLTRPYSFLQPVFEEKENFYPQCKLHPTGRARFFLLGMNLVWFGVFL